MLQGKKLSILGDSLSAYKDVSNDASVCDVLKYNPYFYKDPFPLEKMYWSLLLREFGMTLCVNNSWSGGNLSGRDNPDSGVNRAHRLSRDDGTMPDVIIVLMGMNDLGRNVPLEVFADDYQQTLNTVRNTYPDARVCCVNMPDRDERVKTRTEAFNRIISDAVRTAGDRFFVVDLFSSRLNNDFYYMNTVDGLHPDEDGMRIIAEVIADAWKVRFAEE